jgi:hypothetical protein
VPDVLNDGAGRVRHLGGVDEWERAELFADGQPDDGPALGVA